MPRLDTQDGRVVKGVHSIKIRDAGACILPAVSVFHLGTPTTPDAKHYLAERGAQSARPA